MKNFSDLLATDHHIDLSIELDCIIDNGAPRIGVFVNDKCLLNTWLKEPITVNYSAHLLDPINIRITMNNKEYSAERETAVIIKNIQVDNIKLIPKFDYLAKYINDHNFNNPTNYLGFNGTWILDINRPFYHWLHEHTRQGWLLTPG